MNICHKCKNEITTSRKMIFAGGHAYHVLCLKSDSINTERMSAELREIDKQLNKAYEKAVTLAETIKDLIILKETV